jgi:hypothetical protein
MLEQAWKIEAWGESIRKGRNDQWLTMSQNKNQLKKIANLAKICKDPTLKKAIVNFGVEMRGLERDR